MSSDPLARLRAVVMGCRAVVDGMSAEDLTRRTPSENQDVAAVLGHLIGWQRVFASCLRDDAVPDLVDGSPATVLGPDPVSEWCVASAALLDQLRRRVGDRVELPYRGITAVAVLIRELTAEILLHTWDLATAVVRRWSSTTTTSPPPRRSPVR